MPKDTLKSLKLIITLILLGLAGIYSSWKNPKANYSLNDGKHFWVQKVIYEKKRTTVDLLFIGSSWTFCNIVPTQLEKQLSLPQVWNLAVTLANRESQYYLLKQALENHNVRHILAESTYYEDQRRYQFIDWVIPPEELGNKITIDFSETSLRDFLTYSYRLKEPLERLLQHVLTIAIRPLVSALDVAYFNTIGTPQPWEENKSSKGYYTHRAQNPYFSKMEMGKTPPPIRKQSTGFVKGSYVDYYNHKLLKLAKQYGAKLSFVYLPVYAKGIPSDDVFHYHHNLADGFYVPDLEPVNHPRFWRDYLHLYGEGSHRYTNSLAMLLKHGPQHSPYFSWYFPEEKPPT